MRAKSYFVCYYFDVQYSTVQYQSFNILLPTIDYCRTKEVISTIGSFLLEPVSARLSVYRATVAEYEIVHNYFNFKTSQSSPKEVSVNYRLLFVLYYSFISFF